MLRAVTPSGNDPLGGSLLQFLHEAAGSLGGHRLDQQVEVLRHEQPADEEETCLLPNLPQDLDKSAAEAVAVRELKAAVSIGCDKLHFAGLKMASIDGHEPRMSAKQRKGVTESQSFALRQPAETALSGRSALLIR